MNLDEFQDGIFHVWQPDSVDLIKGSDEEDSPNWKIGGYASTEALDRQGESVLQKGLDFKEFIKHGWYNDNHQQHTAAAVGIPEMAEFKKGKGWYTEGYLLKHVQRARDIFNLAKAIVGTPRRLGFSIEGKILQRLGNRIVRALIRNVAITNSPVNTDCTWGVLEKSWASDVESKALSVGHARTPSTGGRVLVPEDLESDEVKWIYYCPHCTKAFGSTAGIDSHIQKAHVEIVPPGAADYPNVIRRSAKELSPEEAVECIHRLRPDYSDQLCRGLVDYVLETDS